MNILLINHYAGSPLHGMEYRPFYLGREWVRLGHKVTVVAASFSHVRTKSPAFAGSKTVESMDGIDFVWLRTPAYVGNGAGRVRNMLSFLWGLRRHARMLLERVAPDIVIASSTYPLDIYPAARLARRSGARLVFEVHDLWPLSPMELGNIPRWHPYIVVMQRAEDFAYRRADLVVSILPTALGHMQERGLRPEKFVHIPNGIMVEEWERRAALPAAHRAALADAAAKGRALVCYAGAHGTANALDSFVEAADLLRDAPVTLVLTGSGPEKEGLQKKAAAMGLEDVLFLPPVPKSAVPALLEAMDVLFIGLRQQPLFQFGISPNKLMDYMMAGKPIICAIEAGNDPVSECGCGYSVAAESPEAVAGAVTRLLGLTRSEREAMGARGREYVRAHHDYKVLARRFLAAVE